MVKYGHILIKNRVSRQDFLGEFLLSLKAAVEITFVRKGKKVKQGMYRSVGVINDYGRWEKQNKSRSGNRKQSGFFSASVTNDINIYPELSMLVSFEEKFSDNAIRLFDRTFWQNKTPHRAVFFSGILMIIDEYDTFLHSFFSHQYRLIEINHSQLFSVTV